MKVIIPNELELLECSLSETDATDGSLWNSATSYAEAAKVRHEHISYESLAASNKGNDPSKTWSGVEAKWKKLGATLPYLMLDPYVETQTTCPTEGEVLSFTVPFSRATAFALLNVWGYEATITITDDEEGELFRQTYNLVRDISDFSLFEYNYTPIDSITNLVATDLPLAITGTLKVELDPGEGEVAKLGMIVAGREHYVGETLYDAELGVTDYSRKSVDDFGIATLIKRSFASMTSLPIYLHPDRMDYVARLLQTLRATPCVWVGDNSDEGHQSLTTYGWLEDWRMVYAGPNEIQLSLEIQGLI